MQANFSVAYDCYSLKTISDFYNKAYKKQIVHVTKGPCRRLLTGALAYSIYSA